MNTKRSTLVAHAGSLSKALDADYGVLTLPENYSKFLERQSEERAAWAAVDALEAVAASYFTLRNRIELAASKARYAKHQARILALDSLSQENAADTVPEGVDENPHKFLRVYLATAGSLTTERDVPKAVRTFFGRFGIRG